MRGGTITSLNVALLVSVALPLAEAAWSQSPPGKPFVDASAISGCYELAFSSWADTEKWHGVPPDYLPPHRVFLDSVPESRALAHSGRARYAVRAAGTLAGPKPGIPEWSFMSRDSLSLSWSNGFTGTEITFHIGGDTLQGRVVAFVDDEGEQPFPRGNAAGLRVRCGTGVDSTSPEEVARLAALQRLVAPRAGDVELARHENAATGAETSLHDPFFKAFDDSLFQRLHAMIASFRLATGRLPDRLQDLAPYAPVPPPDQRWMRDAWGKPVAYVVHGDRYELRIKGEPRPPDHAGDVVSPEPK
jgi:hypothetical protein